MKTVVGFVSIVYLLLAAPFEAQVCDGISPVDATSLVSVVAESGLTGKPLLVTAPPGDRDRIFIVEQDGFIWVKQRGSAPGVRSLYLNLSPIVTSFGFEQGLLGLAFAPDFATSRLFHVSYTRAGGVFGAGVTTLATFEQNPTKPSEAIPAPVSIFFGLDQTETNHNGGNIQVGSDGYLYLGLGDGGGGGDNHGSCGNGQDLSELLGKIIRIDPTGNSPNPPDCGTGSYTIPDGNPLADGPGGVCDEIWASGVRNPWRWTFDPVNDDLYIADVGQSCWEEINWVPGTSTGGENYGWRSMEAAHCFNPGNPLDCNPLPTICLGAPACNAPSLTLPVKEISRSGGVCSITGGYPYRGCRISNFQGHYFWSDFCLGNVSSFLMDAGAVTLEADWTSTVDPGLILDTTSFGLDGEGELYVVDQGGTILKIVPPLSDFEVSGQGVLGPDMFRLSADALWTWEDLEASSSHPIDYYCVYRGLPNGRFDMQAASSTTQYAGDTDIPNSSEMFAYLVTATSDGGVESGGGAGRLLIDPCIDPTP